MSKEELINKLAKEINDFQESWEHISDEEIYDILEGNASINGSGKEIDVGIDFGKYKVNVQFHKILTGSDHLEKIGKEINDFRDRYKDISDWDNIDDKEILKRIHPSSYDVRGWGFMHGGVRFGEYKANLQIHKMLTE